MRIAEGKLVENQGRFADRKKKHKPFINRLKRCAAFRKANIFSVFLHHYQGSLAMSQVSHTRLVSDPVMGSQLKCDGSMPLHMFLVPYEKITVTQSGVKTIIKMT